KFSRDKPKSTLLTEKKAETTKDAFLNASRLPRSVLKGTEEVLRLDFGLPPRFAEADLRAHLDRSNNLGRWRGIVQLEFEVVWEERKVDEESIQQATHSGLDEEADVDSDMENIRTCTTTLSNIIRPDLWELETSRILSILKG
ncbi:hypothetical protein BGZ54_000380, partial [Gamsiella multidivaricata]